MNRIGARIMKLERGDGHGWRAWAASRVPHTLWPDVALLGVLADSEGWPPGHNPTDAELRAIVQYGKGGTA